jgi:hypothetical protein
MTPNLPTPRVTAAIPVRAVGMAAIANKRDAQIGRAPSLRCWDLGWHSRKGCILAEMDLFFFAFRFWDGFLSNFAFFDAKTTGKSHGITIEHIKHARQCVFDA